MSEGKSVDIHPHVDHGLIRMRVGNLSLLQVKLVVYAMQPSSLFSSAACLETLDHITQEAMHSMCEVIGSVTVSSHCFHLGYTALMYAADRGDQVSLKLLLEASATINCSVSPLPCN